MESKQDTAAALTDAIVGSVAEREDVGPLEIPPLYESIDPEALAGLFRPPEGSVDHVTFTYCGYQVTVEGPGEVRISGSVDDRTQ